MRLSLSPIAAQDVGDRAAVAALRHEVRGWTPTEAMLRCWYSWSDRAFHAEARRWRPSEPMVRLAAAISRDHAIDAIREVGRELASGRAA